MNRRLSLIFLVSITAPASASPKWVDRLMGGPIVFEMANDANAGDFRLRTTGEFIDVPTGKKTVRFQKFCSPLADELGRMQDALGRVVLDCSMFVQVAAVYRRGGENDESVLFVPYGSPAMTMMPFLHGMKMANVGLADVEALNDLQRTHFANKSQWVLPVDGDTFIGLSGSGPKVLDANAWKDELRDGLFRELARDHARYCEALLDDEASPTALFIASATQLVGLLKDMGRLEAYTLRTFGLTFER